MSERDLLACDLVESCQVEREPFGVECCAVESFDVDGGDPARRRPAAAVAAAVLLAVCAVWYGLTALACIVPVLFRLTSAQPSVDSAELLLAAPLAANAAFALSCVAAAVIAAVGRRRVGRRTSSMVAALSSLVSFGWLAVYAALAAHPVAKSGDESLGCFGLAYAGVLLAVSIASFGLLSARSVRSFFAR